MMENIENIQRIKKLADAEGLSVESFLEELMFDNMAFLSNAMCSSCGAEDLREPDCVNGICDECGNHTMDHVVAMLGAF